MHLLALIFLTFLNIVLSEIIVKQQTICDIDEFFDKFLINSQLQCVNIHNHETGSGIVSSNDVSKCLWNYFEEKLQIPVTTNGYLNTICDTHIFVESSNQTFEENDFPPFSNILLINPDLKAFNLHNIFLQSINVFGIKMDLTGNHLEVLPEFLSFIDNKTRDWTKLNQSLLNTQHFIRALLRNDYGIRELSVSYSDCPPSVITTEPILDGTDIRIVKEIGKNWKISFLKHPSRGESKATVTKKMSDIALCPNLITENSVKLNTFTKYNDILCATFLVKKPEKLHPASYIYIPFEKYVWLFFIVNLFVTALLLKIITTIGLKMNKKFWSSSKFNSLTYSFLEIINTTTSHGVFKFPIHLPIKVLLTGWMFLILLVGTNFTTGYTSLLASPPTTKPIDTVQDFIDEGYFWGGRFTPILAELQCVLHSKELINRFKTLPFIPNDWLLTKKYGEFVRILSTDNYAMGAENLSDIAGNLRLMKECLIKTYVGYIIRNDSDLKNIVDIKTTQFIESGIVQHWMRHIDYPKGKKFMFKFFENKMIRSTEHNPLGLNDVASGFFILIIGLCISFIVFLVEVFAKFF